MADAAFQANAFQNNAFQSWSAILYVDLYDIAKSRDEPIFWIASINYILLASIDVIKIREKLTSGNLTIGMIGPYDIIITIEGKILKHISGIVYMEI